MPLSQRTSRSAALGGALSLVVGLGLAAGSTSADAAPPGSAAAPRAAVTATAPSYTTYGAPESFTDAHNAGEPSIGTSFKTDATMYQASLSTYKVDFDDTVSPAKASWSDVSANAGNGCPQGSTVSLDPILYTDHRTGRTFESQLTGVDSLTCFTDDDGKTWSPSEGGGIPSGVDHQTLGGGPRAAGDPIPQLGAYPDVVYYCSQDIATAFCATSHNGGQVFDKSVPAWNLNDCGGLHGHVKVAPDGTAYVPNKDCGGKAAVVASTDGGTTWTVRPIPGTHTSDADPSVGIGRDGTVYTGYVDGSTGKPGVAVSHDRGATWQHVQSLGGDLGINNAVFPAAVAGDGDRAAVAFLGTPTKGDYQASTFAGVWHLYVATTYDGGTTWTTVDATPGDPVQRGSICTGGTTCGNDRNLLDFIDATIDDHGRVLVGFADGCTGACVSDPAKNNHDAYATIARQSAGSPLLSAYDGTLTPARDVSVRLRSVHRRGDRVVAREVVRNTGGVDLARVPWVLTDSGRRVGHGAVRLDAGRRVVRTVRWTPARPHARQRVVARVDPRDRIAEGDEHDNRDRVVLRRLR